MWSTSRYLFSFFSFFFFNVELECLALVCYEELECRVLVGNVELECRVHVGNVELECTMRLGNEEDAFDADIFWFPGVFIRRVGLKYIKTLRLSVGNPLLYRSMVVYVLITLIDDSLCGTTILELVLTLV